MSFKKIIAAFSLPLFLSSILLSQTLVDLAKQEKERRKNLKGQKIISITNSDLRNLKKRPALTTTSLALYQEQAPPETTPPEATPPETPPPQGVEAELGQLPPTESATPEQIEKIVVMLEQRLSTADENVILWRTRLNGLWQEFYSMDDMSDRSGVQQQISDASQRLEKAQEDATKISQELDKWRALIKK